MKELFAETDVDSHNKLNRVQFQTYFSKLAKKIGRADFKLAAKASSECLDDIWFELDKSDSGYISWHSVKPFIARIVEHSAELEEQTKILNEERAAALKEYNHRKQVRAEQKRQEQRKLELEAELEEN